MRTLSKKIGNMGLISISDGLVLPTLRQSTRQTECECLGSELSWVKVKVHGQSIVWARADT